MSYYFPGLEPSPPDPCEIQRQCHAHQFQSLFVSHQDVEEKRIKKSDLIRTINAQKKITSRKHRSGKYIKN